MAAGQRALYSPQWLRAAASRLARPSSLFWFCWAAILGGIALRYPSLTIHAEMFAENGTNLYYHVRHSGFWANVFEFQYYEYLIWFPRLIALVAVKAFDARESYAYVTEWTGHIVTGFFYAFFCLARFRRILPSDPARFVVATALGVGLLGTYELYAFVNFPYHGMFLMLILLFSSVDSRPVPEAIVLAAVVFLVGTSKLHPLAFLPFYLAAVLRRLGRTPGGKGPGPVGRRTPQTALLGTTVLALLIQAGTTLVVNLYIRPAPEEITTQNPIHILSDAAVYYLRAWLHLLFPTEFLTAQAAPPKWMVPGALLPLLGFLGFLCVHLWRRGRRRIVLFFFAANGLALLNMAVTRYTLLQILQENEGGAWALPFQNRWFHLSLTALFLGTIVLVSGVLRRRSLQAAFAAVAVAFVIGVKRDIHSEYRHYITEPEESFSQWKLYAPLTEDPDYAIPLNPHPWMLFHRTVELGTVESGNGRYELPGGIVAEVRSAVVMESSPDLEEACELAAVDEQGRALATARRLTPAGYEHPYYYFDPPVRASRFQLAGDAGEPFAGTITMRFMGAADAPADHVAGLDPLQIR